MLAAVEEPIITSFFVQKQRLNEANDSHTNTKRRGAIFITFIFYK
jgi:hypothetical protein